MDLKQIVIKFNECINNQDIENISKWMHKDYTFIDTGNNIEKGKEKGLRSWKGFFEHFPDYKNVFEEFLVRDDIVIIIGHSVCSEKMLDGKAIWTAKIKDNKIYEWRVYEDTKEIKKELKI